MGGFGSGRWGWHRPKTTVERCLRLDLGAFLRGRPPAAGQAGVLRWPGPPGGAAVGFEVVPAGGGLAVRLRYSWTPSGPPGGDPRAVAVDVRLVPGAVPRGGARWWGVCPLAAAGVPCGRRVGKVYLPPGSPLFGCRHCHRLTYRSRQAHDPRVTRLVNDPDALALLTGDLGRCPVPQLGLVLRALTELQARADRDLRRFEAKRGRPRQPPGERRR